MFSRVTRIIFVIALAGFINACVFSPGMDMRKSLRQGDGLVYAKVQGITQPVPIIEINEELVQELSPGPNRPTIPPEFLAGNTQGNAYRIGVDDILTVVVWGQEELMSGGGGGSSGSPLILRQVREDGTFFFPYAGLVDALGKTREQIRLDLTQKLKKYFKDPQVDIAINDFNSQKVILTGQFNQPKTIPITSVPLSISRAFSSAGGANQQADLTDLQINRNGKLYHFNYHKLANQGAIHDIMLQDGDVLHLPVNQSNSAFVIGEVGRVQKLNLWTGQITLTDALASAGGISSRSGSGNEVFVIRGVDTIAGEKAIYRLNAKSPASYLLASQFEINPQDVVFVGASELTKWNRVISQLFPFASLINAVDNINE